MVYNIWKNIEKINSYQSGREKPVIMMSIQYSAIFKLKKAASEGFSGAAAGVFISSFAFNNFYRFCA